MVGAVVKVFFYIFSRSTGEWLEETKLLIDDKDHHSHSGSSVAISSDGSTAIVGFYYGDNEKGENSGTVCIYRRIDGMWVQQIRLIDNDGGKYGYFGGSVALSSDGCVAIVGAPNSKNSAGANSGAAYIYRYTGDVWLEEVKLVANDVSDGDQFGYLVMLSGTGNAAVVGTYDFDDDLIEYGYLFIRTDGGWVQKCKSQSLSDLCDLISDNSSIFDLT